MSNSVVTQTVGGLSIAILFTLVAFIYGYPAATTSSSDDAQNDKQATAVPFGDDSTLFWNIFVGMTVTVLIVVVLVGFVSPSSSRPPSRGTTTGMGFINTDDLESLDSLRSMRTPSTLSTLSQSMGNGFTFSSSLSSMSSADISTSLGALSQSI